MQTGRCGGIVRHLQAGRHSEHPCVHTGAGSSTDTNGLHACTLKLRSLSKCHMCTWTQRRTHKLPMMQLHDIHP